LSNLITHKYKTQVSTYVEVYADTDTVIPFSESCDMLVCRMYLLIYDPDSCTIVKQKNRKQMSDYTWLSAKHAARLRLLEKLMSAELKNRDI
jgi:hypothetical protein